MVNPRVWLITGASTGFGRALTEYILSQNEIVVATLRKPEVLQSLTETYSEDRLLVLQLDVTIQADIEQAFVRTKEVFGRLDVVFNNAGVPTVGEAEMIPIEDARAMFEVNFWGAVNVSRAAVKFFREINEPGRGGVLLQNSSVAGFAGMPCVSLYAARQVQVFKHALEGYSKCLAMELLPKWNIKICVLQTGTFHTKVMENATFYPENPAYHDEASAFTVFRGVLTAPGFKFKGDKNKYAKTIYSLVASGNIPSAIPIAQDSLKLAKEVAEMREKEIAEAQAWSGDLLRDDSIGDHDIIWE